MREGSPSAQSVKGLSKVKGIETADNSRRRSAVRRVGQEPMLNHLRARLVGYNKLDVDGSLMNWP